MSERILNVKVGEPVEANLARQLKRDYKNVHSDVEKLAEWHAVEKDNQGRCWHPILRFWWTW